MSKVFHEIRDPIHVFIRLKSDERKVLDSRPLQRLRYIHQLALTHLVYPGATHRRFEHSLGVMELADRVYRVVTNAHNITQMVRDHFPEILVSGDRDYWLKHLRMAALIHDIGHLPFSHAAEKTLLPNGWSHERITGKLVLCSEMNRLWKSIHIDPEIIVKLALGPKHCTEFKFSPWESLLTEIITGDAFGVDRMDYLLRDSHHIGVAYGTFDHYRLIDTLRILPVPPSGEGDTQTTFALGVEEGGLQSAEALSLARYFMYSQVYFHPIRRIYDRHLMDFLKEWLPRGLFSIATSKHLNINDTVVDKAITDASNRRASAGHIHARRIVRRQHFKRIYSRNHKDVKINLEAGSKLFAALLTNFGADKFRHDRYTQDSEEPFFPVYLHDGTVDHSANLSTVLNNVPYINIDYIFADRTIAGQAEKWIKHNRETIILPKKEEESDG